IFINENSNFYKLTNSKITKINKSNTNMTNENKPVLDHKDELEANVLNLLSFINRIKFAVIKKIKEENEIEDLELKKISESLYAIILKIYNYFFFFSEIIKKKVKRSICPNTDFIDLLESIDNSFLEIEKYLNGKYDLYFTIHIIYNKLDNTLKNNLPMFVYFVLAMTEKITRKLNNSDKICFKCGEKIRFGLEIDCGISYDSGCYCLEIIGDPLFKCKNCPRFILHD
ncbi:hypothetical protein DMUE_2833, partial [Dictyocoela muelleri]